MSAFDYEGYVYVRPVSRGVALVGDRQLEDVVPSGYYRMKVVFEDLDEDQRKEAAKEVNEL